jgi:hypothetical protein
MNNSAFRFERSQEAVLHNAALLRLYNFDLNKIIVSLHPSQLSYGSEFRNSSELEELLQHHPHWSHLKDILDNGATFPLFPISSEERKNDLHFHLTRGNHKSTMKYKSAMDTSITEDVVCGFALPLPTDTLFDIPNASLAPLGCHKQETINEIGVKIPKYRMTHDQSFPGPSGLSVNLRVQNTNYLQLCTATSYFVLFIIFAAFDSDTQLQRSLSAKWTWMLPIADAIFQVPQLRKVSLYMMVYYLWLYA